MVKLTLEEAYEIREALRIANGSADSAARTVCKFEKLAEAMDGAMQDYYSIIGFKVA